jgi:hypothetical protein
LAGITWLLFTPDSLFNPSYQLSFAATFGLIALFPVFSGVIIIKKSGRLQNWAVKPLLVTLWVSLAAFIATAPILIYHFNRISLFGILANCYAVFLMALSLGACYIAIVLQLIAPPLSIIPMFFSEAMLDWMLSLSQIVKSSPFFALKFSGAYPEMYLAYSLFFLGLSAVAAKFQKKYCVLGLSAAAVCMLVIAWVRADFQKEDAVFFDTNMVPRPRLQCVPGSTGQIKTGRNQSQECGSLMGVHCRNNRIVLAGDFIETPFFSTCRNLITPWLATYPFCRVTMVMIRNQTGLDMRQIDTITACLRPEMICYTPADFSDSIRAESFSLMLEKKKIRFVLVDAAPFACAVAPRCTCYVVPGKAVLNRYYSRQKAKTVIVMTGARIIMDDSMSINSRKVNSQNSMISVTLKKDGIAAIRPFITVEHPLYKFIKTAHENPGILPPL